MEPTEGMKMKVLPFVMMLALCMANCADEKRIGNHTYVPYGVLSKEDEKPCIQYRISFGSVFWSIVFIETIVVPVTLIGFALYEPVSLDTVPKCIESNTVVM
jgi:hypothetical protein